MQFLKKIGHSLGSSWHTPSRRSGSNNYPAISYHCSFTQENKAKILSNHCQRKREFVPTSRLTTDIVMTTRRSACCDCLLFSCDIYKLFIMTQRDPGPHHRSGDHRVEIPRILLDRDVKKHSCSTVHKYTYMCGMCVRDIMRVSVCVCVSHCACVQVQVQVRGRATSK